MPTIPCLIEQLEDTLKAGLHQSDDLTIKYLKRGSIAIFYLQNMIDTKVINHDFLLSMQRQLVSDQDLDVETLMQWLPIVQSKMTDDLEQIIDGLQNGSTYLHVEGQVKGILINAPEKAERSLGISEIETNMNGPQVAFTENRSTNVALIRKYIPHQSLCVEDLEVGVRSKTQVSLMYVKEVASEEDLEALKQRLSQLKIDGIISSSNLVQLIEDNSMSLFPQMLLTEHPDRVGSNLLDGKIAIVVEGSSLVILAPCTFWDFTKSTDDDYIRWNLSVMIRSIRTLAILVSMFLTPIYVSILTFHYQVVPYPLLDSLGETRSKVPFPPIIEALLLEFLIELLREAGARLPTKIGQTIGIVGGIVIGQSAVAAGFTSNVLIMTVALGALASFTTPNFALSITIRMLRFPLIIFAGLWGVVGIMLGGSLLLIHLLRQTSLGHPYLHPIYPLRIHDLKDVIRLPYSYYAQRTTYVKSQDKWKFKPFAAKKNRDIDE